MHTGNNVRYAGNPKRVSRRMHTKLGAEWRQAGHGLKPPWKPLPRPNSAYGRLICEIRICGLGPMAKPPSAKRSASKSETLVFLNVPYGAEPTVVPVFFVSYPQARIGLQIPWPQTQKLYRHVSRLQESSSRALEESA